MGEDHHDEDTNFRLRSLEDWELKYNQPPGNLAGDFYAPALTRSKLYRRTTGYFSSRMLEEVDDYLDDFCLREGHIQIVTSPENIDSKDLEAIRDGEDLRRKIDELAAKELREVITKSHQFSVKEKDRFQLLTWMIERGTLEIKFAANISNGFYDLWHEKGGYFEDAFGDYVSFSGSANETQAGVGGRNGEALNVFLSWKDRHAQKNKDDFDLLWEGKREGVYISSYSRALDGDLKDDFIQVFSPREPNTTKALRIPVNVSEKIPTGKKPPLSEYDPLPSMGSIELHKYQSEAIDQWFEADCKGIFKMATGTGKTFTALAAATRLATELAEEKKPLLVIVVVPGIDLVDQWEQEAQKFNWRTSTQKSGATKQEQRDLEKAFNSFIVKKGKFAEMVIATNKSITPNTVNEDPYLLRKINDHRGKMLFIGDEMHALGTKSTLESLPEHADFRIGLSATPERYKDLKGTENLFDYFGDPVIEIDIHEAIWEYETLCHYDYYPRFIELTDEETKEFRRLSKLIAGNMDAGGEGHPHVGQRQRLMQHADEKMDELRILLQDELAGKSHMFFYSPEGFDPGDKGTSEEGVRATEKIEAMMRENGFKVAQYNGETEREERKVLQKELANGDIDALISMKCLNQGIDVPEARIGVFLSSTKNSQEFVQRRGRILRQSRKTGKVNAVLYDMIVRPPLSEDMTVSEKRLLRSELTRAAELAYSADNKMIQLVELQHYASEYKLEYEEGPIPWLDGIKPSPEEIRSVYMEADNLSGYGAGEDEGLDI
tara:strand:- start:1297 stop:3624 length:2328 start_codon:yes stop_codon:yes gene_type:complete